MLLISFTVIAVSFTLLLGVSMYQSFAVSSRRMMTESTERMLAQTTVGLEDYLVSMRRVSDAMYYDVIKDKDLASDLLDEEMNLLYEAHKDSLVSFSLFRKDGRLLSAAPVATLKPGLQVMQQEWFRRALKQRENLHFSTPHVQNIFDNSSFRYYWVISLSRAVELTDSGVPMMGILLVDMDYSTIEQMMERINDIHSQEYYYLCDGNGEMIYHPRQMQINAGSYPENNLQAAQYDDGVHEEVFQGNRRSVVVNTVSYTGWRLVGVIPRGAYRMGMMRYLASMLVLATVLILLVINRLVSARISSPILRLNDSVCDIEAGNLQPENIYVGGSSEIQHLGRSLRSSLEQIRRLMGDIVIEQEEKRKSELDALQSQINPHFLYNTLDSIVWMIEGERDRDAIFMISQLASLFRISLSKGKTIIPIEDELRHARNYMNIQKVRYKDSFTTRFEIEDDLQKYATVKLVLQPLLENAIYYGVEGMDGDGEILVKGYFENGDIYIAVTDNGFGIPREEAEKLLTEDNRVRRHGSGVGLVNVHKRIRLRFGEQYGLEIESEPDEGTTVRIHLPAIPCTPENRELLEQGKRISRQEAAHEEK